VTAAAPRALLLTGVVGIGKTEVATAIGELLERAALPAAVLDLDWLGWTHLGRSGLPPDEMIARNLAAIWPNLLAAGVRYGVLARALTTRRSLLRLRAALAGTELSVVRLVAPPEAVRSRLERRDSGRRLDEHLRQAAGMAALMDRVRLEDLVVSADGLDSERVAAEVLRSAGWLGRA